MLEGTVDSDDGSGRSGMINDPAVSDEEEDAEYASPLTSEQSSSSPPSKVTLATDDTVST